MTTIEVENNDNLERLLSTNQDMEKKLRKVIRTVIMEARSAMSKVAATEVPSTRDAYRAVKSAVYKRVLGGNINILSPRRAGNQRRSLPTVVHRLERDVNSKGNHRGGNRIPRSRRTEDLLTYWGADAGFILRFNNDGTAQRTSRFGNRGSIAGRMWFGSRSQYALEKAAQSLAERIDELVRQEFNEA